MQSVNNDMDDLFRRAAEDYPLQTNGADWNKVMQGLEAGTGKHMPKSTLKYKSFLWIAAAFLLLICTTYIRRTEPLMQTDRQTEITRSGTIKDKINTNDKITRELPIDVSETVAITKPAISSPFLIPPNEKQQQEPAIEEQPEPGIQEHTPANIPDDPVPVDDDQISGKDSSNLVAQETGKEEKEPVVDLVKDEKKKIQLAPAKRLYAGLVLGPDISTIKSQKVSNTGYTVGLLAGYQFSKRLSLETGILWDRKDYYSSGKHFNKEALGLPQRAKVIEVDGYCKMFEIPVNLKYNWMQKKNFNLFATLGISSYLMKREEYDYVYDYYGNRYKYYKEYDNASRNWTSILNISIGYEKKLGNAGSLRVEPYLKLPLKGVGIGKMPIGSKGVLVGFTRPIR